MAAYSPADSADAMGLDREGLPAAGWRCSEPRIRVAIAVVVLPQEQLGVHGVRVDDLGASRAPAGRRARPAALALASRT